MQRILNESSCDYSGLANTHYMTSPTYPTVQHIVFHIQEISMLFNLFIKL